MNEAHECSGWAGYLFGHRMEPRLDTRTVEQWWQAGMKWSGPMAPPMEPSEHTRTYVCDICERCGYTVRREAA